MVPLIKKQIRQNFTDGKFTKKYIAVHETDNPRVGADAMAHFNNWNDNPGAGASAHFAVDDKCVVQMMDLEDKSWAVGVIYGNPRNITDANNSNTINIEICVNADGDYAKARQNAIDLIKEVLLPATGLTSEAVIRHFDACKKWCPRNMMDNPALWLDFKAQLNGSSAPTLPTPTGSSITKANEAVRQLQVSLNSLGFRGANGLVLTTDGLSGKNTTYAVKAFQGIMGLEQDGVAGSLTNSALESILIKPVLGVTKAKNYYATRYIQYRVGAGIDGGFGNLTAGKVKDWQRTHGLGADGIVGQNTWKAFIG